MPMLPQRISGFVLAAALSSALSATPFTTAKAHDAKCQLLHDAAFLDEPAEISQLLNEGVNVNCLDALKHTPLITATSGASLESFKLLLGAGAKTDVRDEWGQSALERVQEKMASYNIDGGSLYRSIFEQMADMLKDQDGALTR